MFNQVTFKKILVGLDLLDSNKLVFSQALALADITGAQLMLLHALSGDGDGGPVMPVSATWDYYAVTSDRTWALYQSQWQAYEEHGHQALQQFSRQAQAKGVRAEFTQMAKAPGKAICELARSWGADMIVVGSHGRKGLRELFLGSVSNYVTHHAPCSVFLAHLPSPHIPTTPFQQAEKAIASAKREASPKVQLRR